MEEYSYRKLTPETIPNLHKLFRQASKHPLSLEEFHKKYMTEHAGVDYFGFFAYDIKDNPVSFCGITPAIAEIDGKKVLIGQAVDGITHPKHRGKGLYGKLNTLCAQHGKNHNMQYIFAPANEKSYHVFVNQLKWQIAGQTIFFEFKSPMLPFAQICRKNSTLKKIYKIWVNFILIFYRKATTLNTSMPKRPLFMITRDNKYLSYKEYTLKHKLNICGNSVWIKFDGGLKIGEIEPTPLITLKKIIRKLKILAFFTGIRKIRYQCTDNCTDVEIFSQITKPKPGLPLVYHKISGELNPKNMILKYSDIDTF